MALDFPEELPAPPLSLPLRKDAKLLDPVLRPRAPVLDPPQGDANQAISLIQPQRQGIAVLQQLQNVFPELLLCPHIVPGGWGKDLLYRLLDFFRLLHMQLPHLHLSASSFHSIGPSRILFPPPAPPAPGKGFPPQSSFSCPP